jgi:hypothetical protein
LKYLTWWATQKHMSRFHCDTWPIFRNIGIIADRT